MIDTHRQTHREFSKWSRELIDKSVKRSRNSSTLFQLIGTSVRHLFNWLAQHLFRTFLKNFCSTMKIRNDWHGKSAASQSNISCPGLVHNICKKKRNFLNFYPRLKSAETFTVNNASLSPNWTNSLLKSVKETSTFKFQPCCAFQMVHPMKLSGLIA